MYKTILAFLKYRAFGVKVVFGSTYRSRWRFAFFHAAPTTFACMEQQNQWFGHGLRLYLVAK